MIVDRRQMMGVPHRFRVVEYACVFGRHSHLWRRLGAVVFELHEIGALDAIQRAVVDLRRRAEEAEVADT